MRVLNSQQLPIITVSQTAWKICWVFWPLKIYNTQDRFIEWWEGKNQRTNKMILWGLREMKSWQNSQNKSPPKQYKCRTWSTYSVSATCHLPPHKKKLLLLIFGISLATQSPNNDTGGVGSGDVSCLIAIMPFSYFFGSSSSSQFIGQTQTLVYN